MIRDEARKMYPAATEADLDHLEWWNDRNAARSIEAAPSSPVPEVVPTCAEVAEVVKAGELAPVSWHTTRRGLFGLSEVRTARPSGADLVTWVWFTETGDTGMVDGADGRAMAIADAYRAMVRASSPAPVWNFAGEVAP